MLEKLKSIYLKGGGLPPDRVVPTVGLNIGRMEDANAKLVFWDLGGQVRLLGHHTGFYFLIKTSVATLPSIIIDS